MKNFIRFTAAAVLFAALAVMVFSTTGCASSRNQKSSDKQTMYDFIGGGKPEFNGNKY